MKKNLFANLCIIVGIIIVILFVSIIIFKNGKVEKAIENYYYDDFVDVGSKIFSDYNVKTEVEDETVLFYNSDFRINYYFNNKKLNSIQINYNLNENALSGEETVKKIEEIYSVVTSDFSPLKNYLEDDFLILDNYSFNEYDRNHIIDLLDYKAPYSDWSTYYSFDKDGKYGHLSYSLYTRYDNEGFSAFYININ